jgi:NTP pyrophosphatase (non-canonical NTP hydrolase)
MQLAQLSDRALQIHEAFAARARRDGARPWTREEIMQGFVGDVGDLMKLVMAKAGARPIADVDAKLAHELSDCLWSVLVLARLYGVDLEKEFPRTMDGIERKLTAT